MLCDDASLARFEAGDIDPSGFNHVAHVQTAFALLQRMPLSEALGRYAQGLRRLTAAIGQPGKYHETITVAFMTAIADRMARAPQDDWESFRNANADLLQGDWPLHAYTREELGGDARVRFRLPGSRPPPKKLTVLRLVFAGLCAVAAIGALVSTPVDGTPLGRIEWLVMATELVAAMLFALPATRRLGGILLIGAFAGAEAVHTALGGFRFAYLIYSVGVLTLLVAEPPALRRPRRRTPDTPTPLTR